MTTDNGRNMIKATNIFDIEEDEVEILENEDESNDLDEFENMFRSENIKVISVKCAAHTLQLSANDFLRTKKELIKKARQVVITLRTPKHRYIGGFNTISDFFNTYF